MRSSLPPPSLTPARMYDRYAEAPAEMDAALEVVSGSLPRDLLGVLVRNGPGRAQAHGRPYAHPFDGDGMLHGFYFEGGRARYKNRWVRTREFLEEERAGRSLYRNFGTNAPGGAARNLLRTRFKNPANTGVIAHAGRTLALWEGGLPHRIDLATLQTMGRYDFGGVISRGRSAVDRILSPEVPFSAHPKVDPHTGELFGFGLARGLRPKLLVYVVSADGIMAPPRSIVLDELSYVHDFVLTARHLVFVLMPLAFDTTKMLLGRTTPVAALGLREDKRSRIVVVPRHGGAPITFDVDPLYAFHHLNGYDDGHEIVVDSFVMATPPPIAEMGSVFAGEHPYPDPRLTRLRIDLRRRSVRRDILLERPMEFGTTAPSEVGSPTRVGYGLGSAEGSDDGATWHARKRSRSPSFTGVVRFEIASQHSIFHDMGNGFPSEPIVVRCQDGTELILTVVYLAKSHRSELHVLDASDLSTRCVLAVPQHVTPGLHGAFIAA